MSLVTPKQRHKIFEDAGWKCQDCGRTGGLTLDHIVPRSRGGTDALSNLRAVCYGCNQKKADKMPEEVSDEIWARCTRCAGRGVLDIPFGKRCAACAGAGRIPGGKAALRLSRAKRRLQGLT